MKAKRTIRSRLATGGITAGAAFCIGITVLSSSAGWWSDWQAVIFRLSVGIFLAFFGLFLGLALSKKVALGSLTICLFVAVASVIGGFVGRQTSDRFVSSLPFSQSDTQHQPQVVRQALAQATEMHGQVHLKCPPDAKWYHGWRFILDPTARSITHFDDNPLMDVVVDQWTDNLIAFSGARNTSCFWFEIDLQKGTLLVSSRRLSSLSRSKGSQVVCGVVDGFTLDEIKPN